jgi:hypothetical protein
MNATATAHRSVHWDVESMMNRADASTAMTMSTRLRSLANAMLMLLPGAVLPGCERIVQNSLQIPAAETSCRVTRTACSWRAAAPARPEARSSPRVASLPTTSPLEWTRSLATPSSPTTPGVLLTLPCVTRACARS